MRDQAVKEIAEMQGALAQAQKDAAYQRHLNENLLRISRERANADRGLKPKKEHTGYVVMNMQKRKIAEKEQSGLLHNHIMGNGAAESLFCRFH